MSRRASVYAREQKEKEAAPPVEDKSRVRFPDELVFLDNIKENDMPAMNAMLRRASVQVDINGLADSDVNAIDEDTWTPLHAACAQGYSEIAKYLLQKGAKKDIATDEGERPIDLVEADDFDMIRVMLDPNPAPLTEEEDELDNTVDKQDSEEEEEEALPPEGASARRRRGTAAPPSFHTGIPDSDSD